jgi:PAS domain S-box-containing protein
MTSLGATWFRPKGERITVGRSAKTTSVATKSLALRTVFGVHGRSRQQGCVQVKDRVELDSRSPFRGAGELAMLMASHDWTGSELGEPPGWPEALRAATTLILRSAQPMLVIWGPRQVVLYNDAFRQSLGPEKHPRILGQPLRQAFPESFPLLEGEVAGVMVGEGPVWRKDRLIPIHRHGVLTDAYWTYSLTPLEQGGALAGVLMACEETTRTVRGEARVSAENTNLRISLEAGRVGAWSLDLGTNLLSASAAFKTNHRRNPNAEMTFEDLQAAIHPEDQPRVSAAMSRAVERSEDYDVEYRVPRADGRDAWVMVRGRVAYDVQGEPLAMSGVSMDVTGRRHAEEHLRLMVDELNHRVKNTLATVQSITWQTLRQNAPVAQLRDQLDARLMALSAAHNVLTDEKWSGADLQPIVKSACAPFGGEARIDFSGPSARLLPRAAIAVAMAIHELGTNAVKYGALSAPEGGVELTWSYIEVDEAPALQIVWREFGGPIVRPPSRRGFGSRMIQRSLAAELGGAAALDYRPEGVVCTLTLRLSPSILAAKGTRFVVGRDGESWTVADGEEVLAWFESQADAIAYLTDQLNALRIRGRSGTVIFNTAGPSDPPARRIRTGQRSSRLLS